METNNDEVPGYLNLPYTLYHKFRQRGYTFKTRHNQPCQHTQKSTKPDHLGLSNTKEISRLWDLAKNNIQTADTPLPWY